MVACVIVERACKRRSKAVGARRDPESNLNDFESYFCRAPSPKSSTKRSTLSPATGGIESASCEVEKKWPDNPVRIGVFCMRRTIETAPRDGHAIILEDDASGTYDVAHWSAEAGGWVGGNGEPSKIKPTPCYALQGDNFLQQSHAISIS